MKANKKMIQQSLYQETGRVVLLKDLSNLVNDRGKTSRNDLKAVVALLMNKYGNILTKFT